MPRLVKAQLQPPAASPTHLVGQVRRFGRDGILYEVIALAGPDTAKIRVLETGEESSYRISRLTNDPLS